MTQRSLTGLAAFAALAFALAGCNSHAPSLARYEALATDDYRMRHPIRVAPAPRTLTLEVHGRAQGVTPAQAASLRAFAAGYASHGQGPMVIDVPVGGANAVAVELVAQKAITTLNAAGVAYVETRHVNAAPGAGSVLAVTYHAVGARVDDCGLWPGSGTGLAANRSYHNFGCATQRNLAAQVADPRDLVHPRAATPSLASRRYTVMTKHVAGEATSSQYDTSNDAAASTIGE